MEKLPQNVLTAYRLLQGGVKTIKQLAETMNISYAAAIHPYHRAKRLEREVACCPHYAKLIEEMERRAEKVQGRENNRFELNDLFSGSSGDLSLWETAPGSVRGAECQACRRTILKREKAFVLQIKGDDPKSFHRQCLLPLLSDLSRHLNGETPKKKTSHGPITFNDNVSADDPLDNLLLSIRTWNMCRNAGLKTLRDVLEKSDHEILRCKNFGRKSLYELKQEIICHGVPRCDLKRKDTWPFFEKEMLAPPERREPLPSLYEYRYRFTYKGAIVIDISFLGDKMFSSQALAENDVIRTDAQMVLLPHSVILLDLKTGAEVHRIDREGCFPYILVIKPEALERAQLRPPTRDDFMDVEWSAAELYRRMMSQWVPDTEYKGEPGFTFTRQGYGLKRCRSAAHPY